jgi:transcription elongation regulator 1
LRVQVYYYNTLTNESSWERPLGYRGDAARVSAQPKPVATVPVRGTQWAEVTCDDGKKYFFNATTQACGGACCCWVTGRLPLHGAEHAVS